MTQPTHPHLSDEQKAANLLDEWAEAAGVHFVNRSAGQMTTSTVALDDLMQLIRAARSTTPQAAVNEQKAEAALRQVVEAVNAYHLPDGIDAKEAMRRIIGIVDPWPGCQTCNGSGVVGHAPDDYWNCPDCTPPADSTEPIDMVLHCPKCHMQHIDAPDERTANWKNEPHRSHLCHGCGFIWRPADVTTNGVAATKTRGKADGPSTEAGEASDAEFIRAVTRNPAQESKAYSDGTTATGPAPLPEASPSQQSALADLDALEAMYGRNGPTIRIRAALAPVNPASAQAGEVVISDGDYARLAEKAGAAMSWLEEGAEPPSFQSWEVWGRFCDEVRALRPKAQPLTELANWAAESWHAEVAGRPMVNIHRRTLDDTWRQVLRYAGVDDRARLGPTHDELRAQISTKEWEDMNGIASPTKGEDHA